MINQEVKGTLARLLATENLTVEHRKVTTAYFDVDKRVLCLPIWKHASNTVYDLLVGHEVGHALYTPNDPFGDAPQAFVNVIEDARIERLMKETYPGLRKSFFDGYAELWNDDFFGVKHEDLEVLPLIDRINLYFKGNSSMPFSDEEQVWVKRVATTKTFKDVVDLANEMYGHAKKQEDEKPELPEASLNSFDLDSSDGSDSDGDDFEYDVTQPTQKSDRGESDDPVYSGQRDQDGEEADGDVEQSPQSRPSLGGNQAVESYGRDYKETESITDAALQQSLETLVDDDAREWIYLSLPKVDVEKCIIKAEKISEDLKFHFYGRAFSSQEDQQYHFENIEYANNHFEDYKKSAQKSVNYLVKQFEMKKSASEYKRAAISKTGVINTNTLYKYKLTDDIFKKITVVPEGKNHGLVMYLDWSGSMNNILLDTLKQVYNLVWFCRKVGIPFRVYAFQSGYGAYYGGHNSKMHACITPQLKTLAFTPDFSLFEFFSSRQNKRQLDESMKLVYIQAFSMNGYRIQYCQKYGLGGTPLAEAMLCTKSIVSTMKKQENVEKVNVVCLTDGEAQPMSYTYEKAKDDDYYYDEDEYRVSSIGYSHGKIFYLRDPDTGYTRRISNSPYETTQTLVSFLREITDYNWIGIRICNKGELTRLVRSIAFDEELLTKIDKSWKKNKFASIKNEMGFTESFYIPDRGTGYGTEDLEVKQKGEVATKAELQRAFKKHMGSKMTNKTILNAFIENIA